MYTSLTLESSDQQNVAHHLFLQIVLSEPSHTHLRRGCGYFGATALSHCNRDRCPAKPKLFTVWPLTEKAGRPLIQSTVSQTMMCDVSPGELGARARSAVPRTSVRAQVFVVRFSRSLQDQV